MQVQPIFTEVGAGYSPWQRLKRSRESVREGKGREQHRDTAKNGEMSVKKSFQSKGNKGAEKQREETFQ